jgi:cytochrome c553
MKHISLRVSSACLGDARDEKSNIPIRDGIGRPARPVDTIERSASQFRPPAPEARSTVQPHLEPVCLRFAAAAAISLQLLAASAPAADSFRDRVAPLLAAKCGRCHGLEAAESGFRIDRRAEATKGGDSGTPGLVAGQPEKSELFVRISTADKEARMPAEGEPLSADEQKLLRDWIAAGAAWPDDLAELPASMLPAAAGKLEKGAGHWAFQPLERLPVPEALPGLGSNPIDAFLAVKLAERGLAFNPEADPRTLIRRVSFDLIGLPPTPEEIAAFEIACRDSGVDGPYQQLVNRLLASPHYGERWARHWLDVVRFAEGHGFETNQYRPTAYHYRDWVIESFNEDKPFDQFAREQIAGDTLGAHRGTGFLVGGPKDNVVSPDIVLLSNQRADELHDIVSTTSSAFLGLTVGCARCHDHKFDPVPQTDYYRIKAVFEGVQHGERPFHSSEMEAERERQVAALENELAAASKRLAEIRGSSATAGQRPQVSPRENVDVFPPVRAKFLRFTVLATIGGQPCIDELEVFATDGVNVARTAKPTASSVFADGDNPSHKLEHVNDGQYGNAQSWISNESGKGWVQLEFAEPQEIHRVVWSRDRSPMPRFSDRVVTRYEIVVSDDGRAWRTVSSEKDRIPLGATPVPAVGELPPDLSPNERAEAENLIARSAEIEKQLTAHKHAPKAYIGTFAARPGPTHRFFRGDPMAPREVVAPGSLTRFGPAWDLPADAPDADRRARLAAWITAPDNPLTGRVIANRLWHYHFGTGIVDTPSDLGVNGGQPSHRELLDWLASELVANGWRLKAIHRLIVTSRGYRQSSGMRPEAVAVDSGSRLLWRYPPRRLEAEPLRDSILAVSGSLDPTMGGPGFDLFEPNNNHVKVYTTKTTFTEADFRRMIYQIKPRSELDSFFGAFDCPDAGQVQPKRTVSTTPLQALNMLNGDFLLDQSQRFAARVRKEAGDDAGRQTARAVLLAFGREASPAELAAGTALVKEHGLPLLCRSLYNASEFITVY